MEETHGERETEDRPTQERGTEEKEQESVGRRKGRRAWDGGKRYGFRV